MTAAEKRELERQQVEATKARLFNRQKAYLVLFGSDNLAGREVLEDLIVFCRAKKSCVDPDDRLTLVLEGRREVYLRIMEHLESSSEELFRTRTGKELI